MVREEGWPGVPATLGLNVQKDGGRSIPHFCGENTPPSMSRKRSEEPQLSQRTAGTSQHENKHADHHVNLLQLGISVAIHGP